MASPAAKVTPIEAMKAPSAGSCRCSAKASGTAISTVKISTMRPISATTARVPMAAVGSGGDGRQKKVAETWNSFSTWRTMRLFGTKTMTWSLGSMTVSWCAIST